MAGDVAEQDADSVARLACRPCRYAGKGAVAGQDHARRGSTWFGHSLRCTAGVVLHTGSGSSREVICMRYTYKLIQLGRACCPTYCAGPTHPAGTPRSYRCARPPSRGKPHNHDCLDCDRTRFGSNVALTPSPPPNKNALPLSIASCQGEVANMSQAFMNTPQSCQQTL